LLTVSGKQYRPLPGLNSPLKSAHQRSFGRGAGRERRACTQRPRQPIGGRRKRVSRRGRFSRASAGCQAGLPLGSRRLGGQPVGAISAGPMDRLREWDAVWGWLAAPQSPLLCGGHLNRLSGGSPTSVGAVGPALIKRPASRAPSSILERHWFHVADLFRPRLRAAHTQALRSAGRCGRVSE
jgi:hypothetical protein